jgi:hypothetical protein
MGISIVTMPDGRVQLLHTFASAASQDDAEEGNLTHINKVCVAQPKVMKYRVPYSILLA